MGSASHQGSLAYGSVPMHMHGPPPPPPDRYYSNYRPRQPEPAYYPPDRKYFNNDYEEEIPDEDFDNFEDIMPDPVPSKHSSFENPFETDSSDPFSRDYLPPQKSNDYAPNRGRMFSTDSDISAIEIDFDTNEALNQTNSTSYSAPPTQDPM